MAIDDLRHALLHDVLLPELLARPSLLDALCPVVEAHCHTCAAPGSCRLASLPLGRANSRRSGYAWTAGAFLARAYCLDT